MEKTDSFIFYRSFFEAAKDLNSADKLAVYDAIFEYVFENKRKKLSGICGIILTLVTPNIDAALRNRENGKKGGRPKKETTVPENKKGGFSEKETDGSEKAETNKDVNCNVDVDGNLDGNVDEDDSLPFADPLPELPKSLSSDEEKPKRKKRSAEVDAEFIEKMRECYPGVNVDYQKREADGWIASHPGRKMTRPFLNRWLSRAFAEVEAKQQQLDAFFADGPDDETLGRWEAQIQKGEPIR